MNFDEAVAFINGRLRLGIKLGNQRLLALLEHFGNPHERLRVIHIAGTKGKGSTTAFAASILQAAGYRVGQYMSPYVYDLRERIQVNGAMIPKADFARWVTEIQPYADALEHTVHGPLTEFEMKTAVGFCYLAEQAVDYAVIETGLGGRLDATNVVSAPLVSVITTIGMDHMELLGDTEAQIAREKAGIVKPEVPCVTGVSPGSDAEAVIREVCAARSAPLSQVRSGIRLSPTDTLYRGQPDGTLWIATPRRSLAHVQLRMRGAFQHANAAVAVAALDAVSEDHLPPVTDAAVRLGLQVGYAPGRLDRIMDRPTVIVDGAHNEMAAIALAEALRTEYRAEYRRVTLIVGLKRNHDPESFLRPLLALRPYRIIATEPTFQPRPAAEIADAARRHDVSRVEIAPTVEEAARSALTAFAPSDLICVTGSFYTVGEAPPSLWSELLSERKLVLQ
jgi:dihydrofolate synthase/folylpolyglutamate synthase